MLRALSSAAPKALRTQVALAVVIILLSSRGRVGYRKKGKSYITGVSLRLRTPVRYGTTAFGTLRLRNRVPSLFGIAQPNGPLVDEFLRIQKFLDHTCRVN